MSATSIRKSFPAAVDRYLEQLMRERSRPLLYSFRSDWTLRDVSGDAARFGFDPEDRSAAVERLKELFLGLATTQPQDLALVEITDRQLAHLHLVPDGRGFHVLVMDATDDHARVKALQQSDNEAELDLQEKSRALARLREVRSELEEQRQRLEEANSLKNALIATLSHEFRTPLTSIFGYLHVLERKAGADPTELQAVRAVRRSATYLFTLAENLLEYGRGRHDHSILDPVVLDLDQLGQDLVAMFSPLAEDKDLDFTLTIGRDSDVDPIFDEVKLRQILINLLSNAVRYTAQGDIAAHLHWDGTNLAVDVRDTGIGIPEEFRERIFVAFNRGAQSGSKGAGLGLSIVKRLVDQMDGTLDLDSELGLGTCFRIRLPSSPPSAIANSTRSSAELWRNGHTAVVVDDDPDVASLLELMLGDLGFHVRLVGDAAQAVEMVLADPPDVVLVDVALPGLSGNAAVYQLRSQGYGGRIITLSAGASEEARSAALAAGADHYLAKPLNVEQFMHLLQRTARSEPSAALVR